MIISIIILIISSFLFMEFVAWSNHKYVMHGFLWSFHKDHHLTDIASKPVLQKNDLFFLIYATPAIVLIIWGLSAGNPYMIASRCRNFPLWNNLFHFSRCCLSSAFTFFQQPVKCIRKSNHKGPPGTS